ncbi:MAG: hypothetical protein KF745_10325 [Phycisphaeraceae bacterium]|nr:hypothetical protein [Phycisphaeraceae bacterium]
MELRAPIAGALLSLAALAGCDPGYGDPTRSPIATPTFDGRYQLIAEESFQALRADLAAEPDPDRQVLLRQILEGNEDAFADFRITHGVITFGREITQSFALRSATIEDGELRGEAIWHEDIHDPGDMSLEPIRLRLKGDRLEFQLGDEKTGVDQNFEAVLKRMGDNPPRD